MRLALLLAASVALVSAQRRVAAPAQYKVRDEGAEDRRPRLPAPVQSSFGASPEAAAQNVEESGFVHPIDFSGLLRDSILGAEDSGGVPAFGGHGAGSVLGASPAIAPAVFRPSTFDPFGGEQEKSAADESKGFVEPTVRFRSLFDGGAASHGGASSDGGFRMQDFLAAHASTQKEVEDRVHAAAEGRDDDAEEERRGGEGRRAAATEHRVYHGGQEEGEEEDEEEGGKRSRGRQHGASYRTPYQSAERPYDGGRGPAQFGSGHSGSPRSHSGTPRSHSGTPRSHSGTPRSHAASSPERSSDEPYLGPDYSKIAFQVEEGEEEGAGTSPKGSAKQQGGGKKCRKVAKKVTDADVGKGRFRRRSKPAMTCYVCDDPENGGSYESCAYGSSPSDKSYFVSRAYTSKGKKPGNKYRQRRYLPEARFGNHPDAFASGSDAEESRREAPEGDHSLTGEGDSSKAAYEAVSGDSYDENFRRLFPEFTYREVSSPSESSSFSAEAAPEESEEGGEKGAATEEKATDYGYDGPPSEFFLDTAQKKHLEKLVGEFSQKDRTACKKVMKDKMTCFQCVDQKGMQHEECMFVAKSDPKGRHLAYHELKEYRLVPEEREHGVGRGIVGVAASAAVPRLVSLLGGAAVPDASTSSASLVSSHRVPAPSAAASENRRKVEAAEGGRGGGRREAEEAVEEDEEEGEEGLSPAEAAMADGVYADQTSRAFDPVRKIHLPKYMLKKSVHETLFEEFVEASHGKEE